MRDVKLRKEFEELLNEYRAYREIDRVWSLRLRDRVRSLEDSLGLTYEYTEPIEGRFFHKKVEPGE